MFSFPELDSYFGGQIERREPSRNLDSNLSYLGNQGPGYQGPGHPGAGHQGLGHPGLSLLGPNNQVPGHQQEGRETFESNPFLGDNVGSNPVNLIKAPSRLP